MCDTAKDVQEASMTEQLSMEAVDVAEVGCGRIALEGHREKGPGGGGRGGGGGGERQKWWGCGVKEGSFWWIRPGRD